jgi:hypothetical protein
LRSPFCPSKKAEDETDGLVALRDPELVIVVIVLEYLDGWELLTEGIDDLKASLLNVLPEKEVLNVNKSILRFLFDEVVTQATLFDLLDKEFVALLILHEFDNFSEADWLLSEELLVKVESRGQLVDLWIG